MFQNGREIKLNRVCLRNLDLFSAFCDSICFDVFYNCVSVCLDIFLMLISPENRPN